MARAVRDLKMTQQSHEDLILRAWTPFLLRTILIVAAIILVAGLVLMANYSPGFYVSRFQAVRSGHFHARDPMGVTFSKALWGDPHSVMTVGLLVLTLVPLARVAFCFVLFIMERDYIYVAFTAYVLTGLIAGVLLGRIG